MNPEGHAHEISYSNEARLFPFATLESSLDNRVRAHHSRDVTQGIFVITWYPRRHQLLVSDPRAPLPIDTLQRLRGYDYFRYSS